ncbi:virulence-associated protein A [Bartonella australis AUST/NH1]|uniref:Virulence-associated protein A n=1 Tax=Bartonella australis (strain Aust/NH1) TaxID=1094489 RepID=M1N2J8_BARAA|nr:HigA family addiction module antitoxin [Bartonella australis]AGF74139.1 virulence-associated protein A [Bartonella australis AUST/NH1]
MMHNPPHPGYILRDEVIEELGLTVSEAAQRLAMSRVALSRIINGHASISTDLAIRLEMAGISTARLWLSLQTSFDLWQAKQRKQPHITRLVA